MSWMDTMASRLLLECIVFSADSISKLLLIVFAKKTNIFRSFLVLSSILLLLLALFHFWLLKAFEMNDTYLRKKRGRIISTIKGQGSLNKIHHNSSACPRLLV